MCIFVFLCDILLPSGVINDDDDDDNRMCMKLFESSNVELIKECQRYFRCL